MSYLPAVHFLVDGGLFLYNGGRKGGGQMDSYDNDLILMLDDDLFPIIEESEENDV